MGSCQSKTKENATGKEYETGKTEKKQMSFEQPVIIQHNYFISSHIEGKNPQILLTAQNRIQRKSSLLEELSQLNQRKKDCWNNPFQPVYHRKIQRQLSIPDFTTLNSMLATDPQKGSREHLSENKKEIKRTESEDLEKPELFDQSKVMVQTKLDN